MVGDSNLSVEQAPCENGVSISSAGQELCKNDVLVSYAGQASHENGVSVSSARESNNEDMNRRLAFLIDQKIVEDRARTYAFTRYGEGYTLTFNVKGDRDEDKGEGLLCFAAQGWCGCLGLCKDCALNCKNQQKPDNIFTRSEATKKSQIRKQVFIK
nr:hypothetical protein [Tanacetum cinerariifolium]